MSYISVRQAAEKWGVSVRQVQALLKNSRIEGAARFNDRAWMIPAGADKPPDPRPGRKERGEPYHINKMKSLSDDLTEVIAATALPLPRDNPDSILETVKEERIQLIYESELAYMRGNFEPVIRCYQRAASDDAVRLRICPTAIAAAMSMGDYALYKDIENYLAKIIKADLGVDVKAVAEISLDQAYVSADAPTIVSDWMKVGDFSVLPARAKLSAAFNRMRYFFATGQFERCLDIAQTAMSLYETNRGITISDLYARLCCAMACCALHRFDDEKRHLTKAIELYSPHGFITPFVESKGFLGGLLERCLQDSPAFLDSIIRQWERVAPNWIAFHNKFTGDHVPMILTQQEIDVSYLAARRVPRKEIAKQLHYSEGWVNDTLSIIYSKLSISKREELNKFLF